MTDEVKASNILWTDEDVDGLMAMLQRRATDLVGNARRELLAAEMEANERLREMRIELDRIEAEVALFLPTLGSGPAPSTREVPS